jgi:hypothetical protein
VAFGFLIALVFLADLTFFGLVAFGLLADLFGLLLVADFLADLATLAALAGFAGEATGATGATTGVEATGALVTLVVLAFTTFGLEVFGLLVALDCDLAADLAILYFTIINQLIFF